MNWDLITNGSRVQMDSNNLENTHSIFHHNTSGNLMEGINVQAMIDGMKAVSV